ncbi:beta galactosidase jelly roll domain-containing protein [Pseudoxanthomonas sp. PXM03]|uniref:sialate O-acetylesterase n=1 Tax=Pseudoxanthomonas sp. PXM03 TaxID=2769284 RepID=UPI00178189C4|nr:sialate O-acetylesterase [Pseudoxanthomonas sp. PXM03]MBD9437854.1 beta galactosidase jelly roll domain-containing protein [Pseudoxanthomonas sp. PXM03]
MPAAHAVELPRIFADGMVVQRDQPVQVWGQAAPGARVVVAFADRDGTAHADASGHWSLELPALPAGGPHVMRIDDGAGARVLQDVLVGDVWLASGQSNMEWPIAQSADPEGEIARATDPQIRHFKIPKSWAGTPQAQLAGGEWVASSPQAAGKFSAVAHFFARELRKVTGVPIGIIDSTWGGSRIEAWMDAPSQGLDEKALAQQASTLRAQDEQALARTRRNLARWPDLPVDDAGWQSAGTDASAWTPIKVPVLWEATGWNGMDGVAWYRTTFTLTAEEAAAGVTLGVGRIDDSDTTWVNGTQVGQTHMQYNLPRRYTVPASALHAGVNHVAVRVSDFGGGGGIHGDAAEVFVQPQGAAPRTLADWSFRPSSVSVALVDDKNQHPTLLYNAMIHPLQPYALRGVIWYQGESNANTVADALKYRTQFPEMIQQWRRQWQAPELPFLWAQLANFSSGVDQGDQSPWAVLRESQSATLSLPATAQVVTIDIGNPADIHPLNKQDVGKRLALAARHVAYGESMVYHGPVHTQAQFSDGVATLAFDAGASALAVRGDGTRVHGFALAGADRVFHPAEAALVDGGVVVRSDEVKTPVALRYGWSDNPADADLINAAGLPASPFRTDAW